MDGWQSAVLGDARLSSADEPWDLVRAFAHVVKARYLCSQLRQSKDVPRCELEELLENHDEWV